MYCGKCGTKLSDDAAFCTSCGAPTGVAPCDTRSEASQNQAQQPTKSNQFTNNQESVYASNDASSQPVFNTPDSAAKAEPAVIDKKKAIVFGIIAGAIAVAVVVLLFTLFGGGHKASGSSPEGAVSQLEKAFNDLNISEIADCLDSNTKEAFSSYTDSMDYDLSSVVKAIGADISFKLNPTNYEYRTTDNIDYCDVSIDVVASVSFLGQSYDTSSDISLTYVKEGNDWKISGDIDGLEDLIGSLNSLNF